MNEFFSLLTDTSIVALILKLAALTLLLYLFPQQLYQALSPSDWLSNLRWRIFALVTAAITSLMPSICYQIIILMGYNPGSLREVVAVTTNVSILAVAILLVSILKYRPDGEEDK